MILNSYCNSDLNFYDKERCRAIFYHLFLRHQSLFVNLYICFLKIILDIDTITKSRVITAVIFEYLYHNENYHKEHHTYKITSIIIPL